MDKEKITRYTAPIGFLFIILVVIVAWLLLMPSHKKPVEKSYITETSDH